MVEANVGASETGAGDTGEPLSPAALEADLELRMTRLEQFVAALRLVLARFQGGTPAFGTTLFDKLDDPGAGNEVRNLLVEATMDARRDLRVLAHDSPGQSLAKRFAALGESAIELATDFERFRRAIGLAPAPRSPSAAARLDEFSAMAVRALLDIAEATHSPLEDAARLGLVAGAPSPPPERSIDLPARQQRSLAARGSPLAAALWQGVRRRRTRLAAEFAGVAVLAIVILVSALEGGGPVPGIPPGAGSTGAGAGPGQTGAGPVALGTGAPSAPPSPAPTSEPAASNPPPTPGASSAVQAPAVPRSTPRPARTPAPTLAAAVAAARFNDRLALAADSLDGQLSTIMTGGTSDFAVATAAGHQIVTIAMTERAWLLSHPPAGCYEVFYDTAFTTYGGLIAMANAVVDDAVAEDAAGIHKDVATAQGDISMLRQTGSRAVSSCA